MPLRGRSRARAGADGTEEGREVVFVDNAKKDELRDELCEFVRDVVEQNKGGLAAPDALKSLPEVARLLCEWF